MKNILLQLDGDAQPSTFDSVVAIDSGADFLLRHHEVREDQVASLVHGLIFTRGPSELRHSAIFIGGSNVSHAEALYKAACASFFGPLRVSVLLDPNGANTTAAAAVICAARHLNLAGATALVLGGTGPVGQRAAKLLCRAGAVVKLASRTLEKSQQVCQQISESISVAGPSPVVTDSGHKLAAALSGSQIVIAAGAAGITLASQEARQETDSIQVAIDLNAVPPLGLPGIESNDKGTLRADQHCYGALGVGGVKMAIHRAAVARLFQQNDLTLDAEEIHQLGIELESRSAD